MATSKALAFSNNDIAVIAWAFAERLKDCLGFALYRGDIASSSWTPLPAMARFPGVAPGTPQTTKDAPIQKFWWKDLGARRGASYRYRIVPLGGQVGHLKPLDGVAPLTTNIVAVTHDRGDFKVYFNRGFVSSQAVSKKLGTPSAPRLLRHIADPTDSLRRMLSGEIEQGVELLLDRADTADAEIRAALYELNDPNGLELRLQAKDRGRAKSRAVVLGNERDSDTPDVDSTNRQALKDAGATVVDRILSSGHIPHNKFVLIKQDGAPQAVLTGSTNWTSTGLCTQTNNALVIEHAEVASHYSRYWDELERDTATAVAEAKPRFQGQHLRTWAREHNNAMIDNPVKVDDKVTVKVMFSPSTTKVLDAKNPEVPTDMKHVFSLIEGAQHAVLFLAFDPGNNSILDAAGRVLKAKPHLFVRGAMTSTVRATNFAEALHGTTQTEAMHVAVVADEKHGVDYRGIPATNVTKDDAFGAWEAEMYAAGHAIIHDKIVVIDPFSPNCVVIAGSHNLGYRASSNNDENFVIIQGHRALAEAYACHVLDVYDHYAWRWWLAKKPDTFGKPLATDDSWQEQYTHSAELAFWLSSKPVVDDHADSPHDHH